MVEFLETREELRFGGLYLKTTASCAMMFRDATAMLVNKQTMGHSLQGHAKFETPLVGSVDA